MLFLDFETFSLAGYSFDIKSQKFVSPLGTKGKKGLGLVGTYDYAKHHSTEVLAAGYAFDREDVKILYPGSPLPVRFIEYVTAGGMVCAHDAFFEFCIWNFVCVKKYGWPAIPYLQFLDTMSLSYVAGRPGSLKKAAVVGLKDIKKDIEGQSIMRRFSVPQNPTKTDNRVRYLRDTCKTEEEKQLWKKLDEYCTQDVIVTRELFYTLPPLSLAEYQVYLVDQRINARGVKIDLKAVDKAITLFEEGRKLAARELSALTGGNILAVTEATKILNYVNSCDVKLRDLRDNTISNYLKQKNIPDQVRKILDIRQRFGGSAASKLYALKYLAARDGRIRGAFAYAGATRTRRWAGRGIQPQNFIRSGPDFYQCPDCKKYGKKTCVCKSEVKKRKWNNAYAEFIVEKIKTLNYEEINDRYGNPVQLVAGCLRSFLIADTGKVLISSDFSSIEAVVAACVAGEDWIIEEFFRERKYYERIAERMLKVNYEELIKYKKEKGSHHPVRQQAKIAALAGQYGGGIGAYVQFNALDIMNIKSIEENIKKYREACSAIVSMWKEMEQKAISAIKNSGVYFSVKQVSGCDSGVSFIYQGSDLYMQLPNLEKLTYANAIVKKKRVLSRAGWDIYKHLEKYKYEPSDKFLASVPSVFWYLIKYPLAAIKNILTAAYPEVGDVITFEGVNVNSEWGRIETYGGKLFENAIQSISRFIQAEAMVRIEEAGFDIVLHSHDEITAEVSPEFADLKRYESIMSQPPSWARLPDGRLWPILAVEGWVGKKYRK